MLAGAGVLSVVWPGTGTVLGYNAADIVMNYLIVNPLIDTYFGGLPPPASMDAGVSTGDPPLHGPVIQHGVEGNLQGTVSTLELSAMLSH